MSSGADGSNGLTLPELMEIQVGQRSKKMGAFRPKWPEFMGKMRCYIDGFRMF